MHDAFRTLVLTVTLCAAGAAGGADPLAATLMPDPSLSPAEVVRIQLEALRHNDADDRGIAVAFRFASPGNRRSTGPLARFARMIKEGPYALMLRFTHASYAPLQRDGDRAVQGVTLVAPGSPPAVYVFHLSRQHGDGPLEGCWMTDSVGVIREAATQARIPAHARRAARRHG